MAAGTSPIFVATPKSGIVNFATANTARDGSGTIATFHTAGSNGARFARVRVQATGTTTAGVIRLWKKVSGGTYRLYKEILVPAVTPSTSVEAWSGECAPDDGILLGADEVLGISTHNAETFNAFLEEGGDY